jgi:hypothetical protein
MRYEYKRFMYVPAIEPNESIGQGSHAEKRLLKSIGAMGNSGNQVTGDNVGLLLFPYQSSCKIHL